MDKKEAKLQYLRMRLEDSSISEWEKNSIRQRLGICNPVSESDFTTRTGDELFSFVYNYLEEQLSIIRRQKRTNSPLEFLPDNLRMINYLCIYSSTFDDDCLEQMYECEESVDEMRNLSQAFRTINRVDEADLIDSVLQKQEITREEVDLLQEHFWESDAIIQEIETAIEGFITVNISELLKLQTIQ